MSNPYLNTEEIKKAFRSVYLEENYNFLEDDLVKLANAFVKAAAPKIAKQEMELCVDIARSVNTLVSDKIWELRGKA